MLGARLTQLAAKSMGFVGTAGSIDKSDRIGVMQSIAAKMAKCSGVN